MTATARLIPLNGQIQFSAGDPLGSVVTIAHKTPIVRRRAVHGMWRARERGDRFAVRALRHELRQLPSRDPQDPGYRRLKYTRFADDHLLGFIGRKPRPRPSKISWRGSCATNSHSNSTPIRP